MRVGSASEFCLEFVVFWRCIWRDVTSTGGRTVSSYCIWRELDAFPRVLSSLGSAHPSNILFGKHQRDAVVTAVQVVHVSHVSSVVPRDAHILQVKSSTRY